MKRSEIEKLLKEKIKKSTLQDLERMICGLFRRCSEGCPLKQNNSSECLKITEDSEND